MYKWMLLIGMILVFNSCLKHDDCYGDCAPIHLSGRITDTLTGKGVGGATVQAGWKSRTQCILCDETKVDEGKTNSEGYFSFTATLNKDRLANYYLSLSASLPAGYLAHGEFASVQQYTPDPPTLNLTALPKAILDIRLVKNHPDSLFSFDCLYSITRNGGRTGLFAYPPTGDTTFQVETVAGLYTRLYWTNYYAPGVYTDFSDSIICSVVHENVFTISY